MACPWSDRLLQDPTIDLIISPCFLLAYLLHHFAPEAALAYLPTVRTQCTNMYELRILSNPIGMITTRKPLCLFHTGNEIALLASLAWACSFHPTNIQHEKGKARQNRNNFVRNQHCYSRIFKTRSFHTYPKIPLFTWESWTPHFVEYKSKTQPKMAKSHTTKSKQDLKNVINIKEFYIHLVTWLTLLQNKTRGTTIWPALYKIDTQAKTPPTTIIEILPVQNWNLRNHRIWREKVTKKCIYKFYWDLDFVRS